MRTPRTSSRARGRAIAAVAAISLLAAACGDDADDSAGDSATTMSEDTMSDDTMSDDTMGDSTMPMDTTDGTMSAMEPSGPGCADVPADGDGSFSGMADDPAATAASANPVLSTLVTAVTEAELVDTLNGDGPFTIFAPANSAFEKIPAADLEAVLADKELLTSILTYHVVAGEQLDSTALADAGTVETVNGGSLEVAAEGDTVTINGGEATVVCANVQTANATVHIIDSVLMPMMEEGGTATTGATETTAAG